MNKGGPSTPVYLIKPKYIFKSPFLKFDLQNPTNREAQNQQLTEYFNYGFNEDTMNIYAKLVNRTVKVLDHKKNLQYFDEPSQLMRLNDQIPMDFGGFCKFYDPQVFKNDFIQTDQQLFKVFLFNTFKATYINGKQYPMLEFVKSMYPKTNTIKQQQNDDQNNSLPQMIQQISNNLEVKYQQTMKKLIEQNNQQKQAQSNGFIKKSNNFDKKFKPKTQSTKVNAQEKQKRQHKKKQSSSQSSDNSSSGSSQSSSQSESEDQRKRKNKKQKKQRRQRQSSKRDRHRKQRRQRSKQKRSSRSQRRDSRYKDSKKESRHGSFKHQRHQSSKYDSREKDRKHKKKSHDRQRQRSRDKDYRRRHR